MTEIYARIPTVVSMEYGSRLYETATPESDTDYAGIYMPTMVELLLQKIGKGQSSSTGKEHEKNTGDDVDVVNFPLPRFIDLCISGDTTALDMLHCRHPLSAHPIWQELVSKRHMFYSKGMKSYKGFVKSSAMKYGVKGDRLKDLGLAMDFLKENGHLEAKISDMWDTLPESDYLIKVVKNEGSYYEVLGKKYQNSNKVSYVLCQLQKTWDSYGHRTKCAAANEGIDWKAVHHSLRVMYQTRAIFERGDFDYPLPETEFLMRVKRGEADYMTEIAPEFDKFFETYDAMADASDLPEKVDRTYWDKWLVGVYDEWFNITYKVA